MSVGAMRVCFGTSPQSIAGFLNRQWATPNSWHEGRDGVFVAVQTRAGLWAISQPVQDGVSSISARALFRRKTLNRLALEFGMIGCRMDDFAQPKSR